MSQAGTKHSTKSARSSRASNPARKRGLKMLLEQPIGSVAASATTTSPAQPKKARAKRDPVFALIDRHRAAWLAMDQAVGKRNRLETRLHRQGKQALTHDHPTAYLKANPPFVDKPFTSLDYLVNDFQAAFRSSEEFVKAYGTRRALARLRNIKDEIWQEAVTIAHKAGKAHERQQRAVGWLQAEEAANRGHDTEHEALRQLCHTPPATEAGLHALLTYLSELEKMKGGRSGTYNWLEDREEALGIFTVLSRASTALQSGPAVGGRAKRKTTRRKRARSVAANPVSQAA